MLHAIAFAPLMGHTQVNEAYMHSNYSPSNAQTTGSHLGGRCLVRGYVLAQCLACPNTQGLQGRSFNPVMQAAPSPDRMHTVGKASSMQISDNSIVCNSITSHRWMRSVDQAVASTHSSFALQMRQRAAGRTGHSVP